MEKGCNGTTKTVKILIFMINMIEYFKLNLGQQTIACEDRDDR